MESWKHHILERSDYPSDLRGLTRFMYARNYMSITVAESSCLDLPRCEEAIDEDIVLEHRVASGLTMTNMSFGLAEHGDLVTTCPS